MAQKTKATMPGRQCSTENKEQNQHTRPVAGGQSVSTMYFCILGTAPMAQLNHNMLISKQSSNLSLAALVSSKIVGCVLITRQLGGTALQHTQYFPQWGESEPVAGILILRTSFRVAQMQLGASPQSLVDSTDLNHKGNQHYPVLDHALKYTSHSGEIKPTQLFGDLTYTKNAGQTPDLAFAQPFGSIPCRRNSALANSFIQFPKLTPSRSAASFSCWRSSGLILIWNVGDQPSPLGVLSRFIVDTYVRNLLTWILLCTYVNTSSIEKTTPQTVGAVLGRLTKPLIEVTVMADKQHTQTHPKFTWLFLATPKSHPECSPVVLRFDTDTEENARAAFPGWEMVFAAKIRAEAPCRVAFFDYNTRRGWAFDSASDREVVGHD